MTATSERTAAGSGSFRDPGGTVLRHHGRIVRLVKADHVEDLEAFLDTRAAREATDAGSLIRSFRRPISDFPALDTFAYRTIYEHERIAFPSYPHEWPAEMLEAAGALSLELFERTLEEGFGLKDATPFNVLFRGPEPVFVDVLSFERRDPRDAVWMAYAQFVRTFLLPMLAHRSFGLAPHSVFMTYREGLDPQTMYRWAGLSKRLTPGFFSLVTLPQWMSGRGSAAMYQSKPLDSAEKARFVLGRLLASCGRNLSRLAPGAGAGSVWSGYLDYKSLYSPAQLAAKEAFVREALELAQPRTVLDVGANEGRFSFLAAETGASVVAIDTDPVVVGTIWREARRRKLGVLPLVVDLARPTPALGWRNRECESFLERASGHFDMILMLAVLHHLMVSEGVPLEQIFGLLSGLSAPFALIEYVGPADPMFTRIVRGRSALYDHLTAPAFEAAAEPHFEIVKSLRLDGMERWLYLLRRRDKD